MPNYITINPSSRRIKDDAVNAGKVTIAGISTGKALGIMKRQIPNCA